MAFRGIDIDVFWNCMSQRDSEHFVIFNTSVILWMLYTHVTYPSQKAFNIGLPIPLHSQCRTGSTEAANHIVLSDLELSS